MDLNAVYDQSSKDEQNEMFPYLPFLRRKGRGTVLEIGTCQGYSTAAFLLGVEKNGGHVFSVDIDPRCGELYKGHPQWTFIYANSLEVEKIRHAVGRPVDVLLIDGDHTHPVVDHDIEHYGPVVVPGGVILMHDIVIGDVRDAYHAWVVRNKMTHFELPGPWGLGVMYPE